MSVSEQIARNIRNAGYDYRLRDLMITIRNEKKNNTRKEVKDEIERHKVNETCPQGR